MFRRLNCLIGRSYISYTEENVKFRNSDVQISSIIDKKNSNSSSFQLPAISNEMDNNEKKIYKFSRKLPSIPKNGVISTLCDMTPFFGIFKRC